MWIMTFLEWRSAILISVLSVEKVLETIEHLFYEYEYSKAIWIAAENMDNNCPIS